MNGAGANRRRLSPRLTVVWGVLLVLVGAIVTIELADRAQTQREDRVRPRRDPRLLLPVPLEEVGVVEVAYAGAVHRFERDAAGAWFYHGVHVNANAAHMHQADPAMAQRIETAFQGFGRTRMERSLPTGVAVQQYGLANPQMVILVYRPKELQPLLQVAVGDLAPDKLSRYVMAVGSSSVVTIANYQIDNLLALIKAAAESGQGQATIKSS
ncbi:MAG TPA: hypothetical protein VMH26_09465 [Burkholderiales bacterium]|nr:hypothetical protein [Burkholderiales bacterium]